MPECHAASIEQGHAADPVATDGSHRGDRAVNVAAELDRWNRLDF